MVRQINSCFECPNFRFKTLPERKSHCFCGLTFETISGSIRTEIAQHCTLKNYAEFERPFSECQIPP